MQANSKKLTKGFTIIEVLIVLTIAGLILAIVFLAVPALQRNSRNTAIRSDAASILAGVNDYIANNQGSLPTALSQNGNIVTIGASGTTQTEAKIRGSTQVTFNQGMPCGNTPSNQPGCTGIINIQTNSKCNGNVFQAAQRAVAAGFRIENSSSQHSPQCIES
jgi:prepilin-type N-terminal cleavage/methylation domain-containing protein